MHAIENAHIPKNGFSSFDISNDRKFKSI